MKKCITIFISNLLHVLLNQHKIIIIPIYDNLEGETYFFENKDINLQYQHMLFKYYAKYY